MRALVDHGLQLFEARETLGAPVRECAGREKRCVQERVGVGRVDVDAVAVADRRQVADRARVVDRVRHEVGELELRAGLVFDEGHAAVTIVTAERQLESRYP